MTSAQLAGVVGNIDCVFTEQLQRDDLQCPLVGGGENNRGGDTVAGGPVPVDGRNAPSVARLQSGKPIHGRRCGEVVTDALLVLEELR